METLSVFENSGPCFNWLTQAPGEQGIPWKRGQETVPSRDVVGCIFPCDETGKDYISGLLKTEWGFTYHSVDPIWAKPKSFDFASLGFLAQIGEGAINGKTLPINISGSLVRVTLTTNQYLLMAYMPSDLRCQSIARDWLERRLPSAHFTDPVNLHALINHCK